MPPDQELLDAVALALGESTSPAQFCQVGGGDINHAATARFGPRRVFIKYGGVSLAGFAAEARALQALKAAADRLTVPTPLAWGDAGNRAFLVLEQLQFAPRTAASEALLGRELAAIHKPVQPWFGWHEDNFIGATPQPNGRCDRWPEFFMERRLRHQAQLLDDAHISALVERLGDNLESLFAGYSPYPSLLHGDLWGGNWGALGAAGAAIYDPASYFGCRESDLAMTQLFGGFGASFYQAYNDVLPLSPSYPKRRPLYQLYHLLNHANLFGGSYRQQAAAVMQNLCS